MIIICRGELALLLHLFLLLLFLWLLVILALDKRHLLIIIAVFLFVTLVLGSLDLFGDERLLYLETVQFGNLPGQLEITAETSNAVVQVLLGLFGGLFVLQESLVRLDLASQLLFPLDLVL